jgi:hypothetical protein
LTEADLASPGTTFQIGVPPIRVDVITTIDGVEFDDAWAARILAPFANQTAPILLRDDLIRNSAPPLHVRARVKRAGLFGTLYSLAASALSSARRSSLYGEVHSSGEKSDARYTAVRCA